MLRESALRCSIEVQFAEMLLHARPDGRDKPALDIQNLRMIPDGLSAGSSKERIKKSIWRKDYEMLVIFKGSNLGELTMGTRRIACETAG